MIGQLRIEAAMRDGKTFLKNSFCTQPFKLADITEEKNGALLHLMMMSSSPGILDNDQYKITIDLDDDCSVKLDTQSYQRLFHMKTGARQDIELSMGKNASFFFLPHPSVPHECSIFSAKNTFHLSEGCQLIWGEVITCGRKLNGEVFRFSKYHTITEIFSSGKLIAKENLLVVPASGNVGAIGQFEGYTHHASFTYVGNMFSVTPILKNIHELLLLETGISFGVSAFSGNGFLVRLLGYKSEQLYNILHSIALHMTSFQNKRPVKINAYAR